MPLMSSVKNTVVEGREFNSIEVNYLLDIAQQSIEHGLATGGPVKVDHAVTPPGLEMNGTCFVTLKLAGQLRGCIGNLSGSGSLLDGIASNAYQAAFKDPRFAPVSRKEVDQLEIEVSVLTPMQSLPVKSNAELLGKLRPGIDGLVFMAGDKQATFLPSVWEQLPDAAAFVARLKQKAGLAADFWSDDVRCEVYQAIKIAH